MPLITLQKASKKAGLSTKQKLKPLTNNDEIPIPAYQFSIEMDGQVVALFQSVSGIAVHRAVEEKSEGGVNNYKHKLPGPFSYGNLTLETGLSSSDFFWKWMMVGQYDGSAQKKDFSLIQRRPNPKAASPAFVVVKRWSFHDAFPVSWKLSNLSVDTTQKIAIETIELAFNYFELMK